MVRIETLLQKSKDTLQEDGIGVFFDKAINYVRKTLKKEDHSESPDKMFMDVLFINGCYLPHPSRYRISHQREQLSAANKSFLKILH